MSSLAIGFSPFFYTSNEMPGWYQMTNAGSRDFAQMSLGCMVLDGYNTWSYNQQSVSSNYSVAYSSIWNNMVVNLFGLATSAGSYISSLWGANPSAGSAGTGAGAGAGAGTGAGTGTAASGAGSGNDAALKKAQEEAEQAKKEAEAQRKAAEEYKKKYEELQGKKAQG